MRYLLADEIQDGKGISLSNHVLVIDNDNRIDCIVPLADLEESKVERFSGLICPGFVNAHCHLELSHLKDRIKEKEGFLKFALSLMRQRDEISIDKRIEAMRLADIEMWNNGVSACGDISNSIESASVKLQSGIAYHTFIELIGFDPQKANTVFEKGNELMCAFNKLNLKASLSAHAPYSVSIDLMKLIFIDCQERQSPFTIHNQESEQENVFFNSGLGDFNSLYETLNLDISFFRYPKKNSLSFYAENYLSENTLLVHNTFTKAEDLEFIKELKLQPWFCFCPNANIYIESKLPDPKLISNYSDKIVLGTDSLASNNGLSILDEMKTIQSCYSEIELSQMIKWACYNGAQFLKMDNELGSFEKGKRPGVIHLEGIVSGKLTKDTRVKRLL